MRLFSDQRFLAFYSGGLTVALVFLLSGGAAPRGKKARFEAVEAQRIDIVEPDGTLRLVLSSRTRFPGLIVRGKEQRHERGSAGFLFYNDEGTENGGLIVSGRRGPDGKVSAGGSLTFDQYEQDQVIQFSQDEYDGSRQAGIRVNDRPDRPMDFGAFDKYQAMAEGPEKEVALKALSERGFKNTNRLFVGKSQDRSVSVELKDTEGRKRLVLQVAPDGAPSLVFLGPDGKELDRFPRPSGG